MDMICEVRNEGRGVSEDVEKIVLRQPLNSFRKLHARARNVDEDKERYERRKYDTTTAKA